MSQTSVQHPETIRFGSGKLEIGNDIDSLVDVGACTEIKFTHEIGDKVTIKSDNAGVILERAANQTASVEANLMEINLDVLAQYAGGISKLTTTEAEEKTATSEEHTLVGTSFIRLDFRNGDGTQVNITSLQKKGGGAATEGTDYVVAVDADGYTCIARNSDSSVISSGDVIAVTYQYTPPVQKRLSFGGLSTLNASVARITNYNSKGQPFSITVYKATADSGIEIEFQADDADEADVVPIVLKGTEDASREAGDQLFVIEDEQF